MNARILASLTLIALASASIGAGTYAFYSDTETSVGNTFSAGTLDLTVGAPSPSTFVFGANLAPGASASGSLVIARSGTIASAADLDIGATVAVNDNLGDPNDPDAGGPSGFSISHYLMLTSFTYNGQDLRAILLSGGADTTGDGKISLAELDAYGTFADRADPGAGATVALGVTLDITAPNHIKNDEASLTLVFLLAQTAEPDLSA